MKQLLSQTQFEALSMRVRRSVERSGCQHTLKWTRSVLRACGCDAAAQRANVEKLMDLGALCDCEVLLNVSPEVWLAGAEEDLLGPDLVGEAAMSELVSEKMWQAVQLAVNWDGDEPG